MNTTPDPSAPTQTHLVVGAGPVGRATAGRLAERGHDVVVLTRSGTDVGIAGVRSVAGDASDLDSLVRHATGAASIVNAANPPYHRWDELWPPMAEAMLAAAEQTGATLVTMSNLYGYGEGPYDESSPMTEASPLGAESSKGQIRARMWRQALAAHEAGRARVVEARASDFIGPGLGDGSHMGDRVTDRVAKGKSAQVFGAVDQPHSWTYMGDVGRLLADLATTPSSWGRVWHVPTNAPRTATQVVHDMCRAHGVEPVKVSTMPKWMLFAAGVVVPAIRELGEVRYQFDAPFVMDSSAATEAFGWSATPWDEVMAATMAPYGGAAADGATTKHAA